MSLNSWKRIQVTPSPPTPPSHLPPNAPPLPPAGVGRVKLSESMPVSSIALAQVRVGGLSQLQNLKPLLRHLLTP
jgi:hypothetical protein